MSGVLSGMRKAHPQAAENNLSSRCLCICGLVSVPKPTQTLPRHPHPPNKGAMYNLHYYDFCNVLMGPKGQMVDVPRSLSSQDADSTSLEGQPRLAVRRRVVDTYSRPGEGASLWLENGHNHASRLFFASTNCSQLFFSETHERSATCTFTCCALF